LEENVMTSQNYVNHIALVLDASLSMTRHRAEVVRVVDDQIAHLGRRSTELNQETRVTVYTFNDTARCVIYDRDVLRLPSIAEFYRPSGNTALIDATLLSLDDLMLTPEKYGDHAFLVYVLTDGEENRSNPGSQARLIRTLQTLPDHWTVAALVPNAQGKHEAKKFGFPADNVAVWDITSVDGLVEAGATITRATDAYMTSRATGVRGTRTLFSTGADAVNKATVAAAGLKPLDFSQFTLIPVPPQWNGKQIRDFVTDAGLPYVVGRSFYQLSKRETIQPQKQVAIVEKKTAKVYVGREARQLIGLPDTEVRVFPDFNPDYTIYVQSTSVNRHLVTGTKVLVLA
jgi:hypothetical protein